MFLNNIYANDKEYSSKMHNLQGITAGQILINNKHLCLKIFYLVL